MAITMADTPKITIKKVLELKKVITDIRGNAMTYPDEKSPRDAAGNFTKQRDLCLRDVLVSACGIFAASIDPKNPDAARGENIRVVGLGEKLFQEDELELGEAEIALLKRILNLHAGFTAVVKVKTDRLLDGAREVEYTETKVEDVKVGKKKKEK